MGGERRRDAGEKLRKKLALTAEQRLGEKGRVRLKKRGENQKGARPGHPMKLSSGDRGLICHQGGDPSSDLRRTGIPAEKEELSAGKEGKK